MTPCRSLCPKSFPASQCIHLYVSSVDRLDRAPMNATDKSDQPYTLADHPPGKVHSRIKPPVTAYEMACRIFCSYGFSFMLLQMTSEGDISL